MLGETQGSAPSPMRTRLIVEPAAPVGVSVLPLEDPGAASRVAASSGIPAAVLAQHGARVRQTHRRANVIVLEVPESGQAALARDLAAVGFVVRPPKPVYPLLNETVPALGVPAVWDAGFGGAQVRIAIVDTGVDRHPDFADRIAATRDFTGHGGMDDVGHGTHVAGIAAGAGAVYRGVAPRASLVIAKALGVTGGTEDAVLAAMSWASRQRIDVMNLSLGGPGDPRDPLSREVDALAREGILVCVAAGNAGPAARTIGSPGCAAGAITVGATGKDRRIASYSSRGPVPGLGAHKPDVLAIGGGVTPSAGCQYGIGVASARAAALDADPCALSPRYVRMSGTSMATPHVAGLCALLVEASRARNPRLARAARAAAVKRALLQSAVDVGVGADAGGAGIIDGKGALAALATSRSSRDSVSSASPAMAMSGTEPK